MAYYPSLNPASETTGSVHPDPSESEVDLTLRLGSSDDIDKNPPYFSYFLNPGPMKPPEHANAANFTGTEPQAVNPFDFIYGKGSTAQGGQSHDTNYTWSSETRNHFLNSNGLDRAASGGTFYSNYYNIPPAPQMNEYILLNPPSRRGGRSSGGLFSGPRGSRRQTEVNYNDPNKRCTNYNCGTNNTPMWRKGPLGPKSLCNACGIKYRKEEEKRKARLEAGSSGMGNQDKH